MQTSSVTVGSATTSSWIPLSSFANPFSVSLGCTISSGANLTYKVQHTFDPLEKKQECSISRSGTTATLILTDHGLTAGDSIIVENAGAPFDGTFAVASVSDANTITYTVLNSGATASTLGCSIIILRVFDNSTVTGETTKADGNYAFPVSAVRLNVTSYTSGKVTLTVRQSGE